MVDSTIPNDSLTEPVVRPVLLVDEGVYRSYTVYLRRILVGLADTAHASALVCPGDIDTSVVDCPTVELFEYPTLRLSLFKSLNRRILLERLERFKPTVLHTFSPGQIELAAFLSEALEVPLVVTFHGHRGHWNHRAKAMLQAARVLAPSAVLAERAAMLYPTLRERIELVPVGSYVEDTCVCFSHVHRPASLIAVHPFEDARLFEPLLGAVRHLALDGCELVLALMGVGPAERAIRRQIRAMGLSPRVALVPPMRPLRTVLEGADVFLHLKDRGLFNAQLIEAMSVGLAVAGVADQTGGLLIDGQTATLWDGADELSIYAGLKRLLNQREVARQFALNAQAFLQHHCSVSGMIDKTLAAYIAAQQQYKGQSASTTG